MARFHEVKLEIVRPGPAHGQLLSPLTPYLALCGAGSPTTFHVRIEQHKLLGQLEALRCQVPRVRDAMLLEVGRDVEDVLQQVPGLLAEIARTRGLVDASRSQASIALPESRAEAQFVHLRLVLGGSELALLPFEMARAPAAMPGEGLTLCTQLDLPIVVTRETRASQLRRAPWNDTRDTRVLLVAAEPLDTKVPLDQHREALERALEPWAPRGRVEGTRSALRVLANASLEALYELCSKESFTHVHVLAHGAPFEVAGERRFGVALCQPGNPKALDVVSGARLAKALQAEGGDGVERSGPLVVTLMTCESAQQGSVLVPGGSVAHDLYVEGIPWVFASQLPLTIDGSVRLTEALYPRLLRGDDPRQALFEVRRQLYLDAHIDLDWAGLVAYASLSPDFTYEVATFRGHQTRRAIEVDLARADGGSEAERSQALAAAAARLAAWNAHLPPGRDEKARERRTEYHGIHGATLKRMALLAPRNRPDSAQQNLAQALEAYRLAVEQWDTDSGRQYHWVATQMLSLAALLGEERDRDTLAIAKRLAERDLRNDFALTRAWAHASLAELEMLSLYHRRDGVPGDLGRRVVEHCHAVVKLSGAKSFPVESTRRQFARYLIHWRRPEWNDIAQAAFEALGGTQAELGKELGRGAEVRAQAKADEAPERPSAEAASDRAGRRVKKPAKRAAKQR